jgi:hypothetical protein
MNGNSPPSAFQATLAMIQTEPQIAESAAALHDNVYLCQLIAGARFGDEAAQDPEIVFTLLPILTGLIEQYAAEAGTEQDVEEGASYAHLDGEEIVSVWENPDPIGESEVTHDPAFPVTGVADAPIPVG